MSDVWDAPAPGEERDAGARDTQGASAGSLPVEAGTQTRASAGTSGEAPLLRVESLCKRYGKRQALSDVSFCARVGESIAVIGPNGAGKTTLLSILAGVQPPSSGRLSRPACELGWVPQQPALYSKLSVVENLRLFARLERIPVPEAVVQRMLERIGLVERADDRVERLSGGNRQRVNVALGLLGDPPVVLLDEPSTALDPYQRQRLWEFVGELGEHGTCVLFSTHIVSEAAHHADRVLVLDEGRLLFDGAPGELGRASGEAGEESDDEDFERVFVAFLNGARA